MIDWDEKGFLAAAEAAIEAGEEDGADAVEKSARQYLTRAKGHGDDAPHLADALKKVKSKFARGGYIVGVFDPAPPPKWEDSVGARAVFYEYGHAAPYKGRGNVKRANIQKVTTPKPFLKAALKKHRATIKKAIQDKL